MIRATNYFPRGFLWGTATASHQVEGDNTNNDWWDWEQEPDRILHGHRSGKACDWWGGRWKEDLDRAVEFGQNTHRLSIEWSRVEPNPAVWDDEALDYYRQIIKGILERGMMPMVTLHHFTNPCWIAEQGGWQNPEIVSQFERYTRKVVATLQDIVGLWVTINEPNVLWIRGYLLGDWPPGEQDPKMLPEVLRNLVLAHAAAYHAIHDIQPGALVGLAHHYRGFNPASPHNPLHRWVATRKHELFNLIFPRAVNSGRLRFITWRDYIPQAAGTQDFFGLNYYTVERSFLDLMRPRSVVKAAPYLADTDVSPSGYIANDPSGLRDALIMAKHAGVPIYITENGVEDERDEFRRRYLVMHVQQIWRAVNQGMPVRGYYHWSLLDNFEWERGWTQCFGLWALDSESQARTKRQSADLYGEICRLNGLSSEIVAVYTPEILDELYPPKGPVELVVRGD